MPNPHGKSRSLSTSASVHNRERLEVVYVITFIVQINIYNKNKLQAAEWPPEALPTDRARRNFGVYPGCFAFVPQRLKSRLPCYRAKKAGY
jgi:hypothetical protein